MRLALLVFLMSTFALANEQAARPQLDVVFVLDTTGSMSGLLEGAKQKVWSLASRMASGTPTPLIRVGLVAFRDKGDAYVTRATPLTADLDAVYTQLKALKADGGGDTPEHVGRGLGEAVRGMQWSQAPGTSRMVFLVGDAPSHVYNDGFNLKDMAREAIRKGIVVNTIRVGGAPATEVEFKAVALLADGTYVSLEQSGGMVATATPYDEKLKALSSELSDTAVHAGAAGVRREAEEKRSELEGMGAAASADRAAFQAKSGRLAAPAAPGLVDLSARPEALATVAPKDLPEPLRTLAPAEQAKVVAQKAARRKVLEQEISQVARERDRWMVDNVSPKADAFDDNVFESVKANAAKVGVKY